MSTLWTTLGLTEATNDQRAIKKAYAKKLRVTRPDDDPEGFMALRAALEQALSYVANPINIVPAEPQTIDVPGRAESPADHDTEPDTIIKADSPEQVEAVHPPSVMDDIEALLKDPFKRNDPNYWVNIFEDERLDSIDAALDFEEQFRDFLLEILGYYDGDAALHNSNRTPKLFNTRVGTRIFDRMGWRDSQGRPLYIQDQIEFLRLDLDVLNKPPLSGPSNKGTPHAGITEDETDVSPWKIAIGLVVIVQILRLLFENIR